MHDVSLDDCVATYNHVLSSLLDEHAPMKQKSFVERDLKPWITDEILDEKRACRKSEKQWRKNKLTVHQISYKEHCVKVQLIIKKTKTDYFRDKIEKCEGDQGKILEIVNSLLGRTKASSLPSAVNHMTLANSFNGFFISKIQTLRDNLTFLEDTVSELSFSSVSDILSISTSVLHEFCLTTSEEVTKIIKKAPKASCGPDPIPTKLLVDVLLAVVSFITRIVNLSFSSGSFPQCLKSAIVKPLLKKTNLTFLSKVIKRVISARLFTHMEQNGLLEEMQSAYKAGHSTESALLC